MFKCKDCLHYCACSAFSKIINAAVNVDIGCEYFAERSKYAEVVHGRWLKLSPWNNHTQSCLCLNCDSISYQKKSGVYIGKIPNYCPNCGAKMDGGNEDG